ncbi:MAG: ribonucleotide reductase N-terminal alpha domain-containing protein [Candidatus Izemoplasma sp.]
MKEENILERISRERKQGIAIGSIPEWYTTGGYQMYLEKYQNKDETVKQAFHRISNAAAKHLPSNMANEYRVKFFDLMWKGWLAPSSPVMSNMGTNRGCPVSCSGNYIGDSIYDFYDSELETAMLTKYGFGTSSYLGDIRPRGSSISIGGTASGVIQVVKDYIQLSEHVSQGNTRRGAWAGYLDIDHGDFFELADLVAAEPDGLNIGWNISDDFIERLNNNDEDAHIRYARALKVKCLTGKGYFVFIDRANRANPPMYTENGLKVKASNLCSEIMLHSDSDHTFTCVLSSMNIAKFDEWEGTDAIFDSTIFLDCVASEFIEMGSQIKGLEKAVRFTEKGRALGLGTLGFHSYLQQKEWPYESFNSFSFNTHLYQQLDEESLRASKYLAELLGEPEWCRGFGLRNTHRCAIAPNSSSALLCGGVSPSTEPFCENVFNQTGPAGEIRRINPWCLNLLKSKGMYNKKTINAIINDNGSIQGIEGFSDEEKRLGLTAFEIPQEAILAMASSRQKYIDQGQSLNLFFDSNAKEEYIAHIHQLAFEDKYIKALYYMRSKAGIQAAKEEDSCLACQG